MGIDLQEAEGYREVTFDHVKHACWFLLAAIAVWFGLSELRSIHADLTAATAKQGPSLTATTQNLASITSRLDQLLQSLNDSRTGVPAVLATINGHHGLREILTNVDGLTADARKTTLTTEQAASKEKDDVHQAMTDIIGFVARADTNVNGPDGILPALTSDLKKTGTSMDMLTTDSHTLLVASANTITQAGTTFTNPDIAATLHNLNLMSVSGAGAMAHLDNTAGEFEVTGGYIRDMFKPQKEAFWKMLLGQIVSHAAGPAAGAIVTGLIPTRVTVTGNVPVTVTTGK